MVRSIMQAAHLVFFTYYRDFYGLSAARNRLITHLEITQKQISIEGRNFTYLSSGNVKSGRPVVFLHGSPGDALDWRKILKTGTQKYHFIALDRPGYGPLDRIKAAPQSNMQMLEKILEHLTQEREAILVGHSMGAGFAAHLAAKTPNRIKGLVFIGGALDPVLERVHPAQILFGIKPLNWFLSRSLQNSNEERIEYADNFIGALQKKCKDIICPVAMVYERNARLAPHENTDIVRKTFTNAKRVDMIKPPSGKHFLNKTPPQKILEAIDAVNS